MDLDRTVLLLLVLLVVAGGPGARADQGEVRRLSSASAEPRAPAPQGAGAPPPTLRGTAALHPAEDSPLGAQRYLLGGPVHALAVSPRGDTVAVAGALGGVRLVDAQGGLERARLASPHEAVDPVHALAFTPDGDYLLVVSPGTLTRWSVASGALVEAVELAHVDVSAFALAPDGSRFAVAHGGRLLVAPTDDPGRGRLLADLASPLRSLAFSPDSLALFAGGEDQVVRLLEASDGQEVLRLEGHRGWVTTLAVTPEGGRVLSGGDDNLLRVWDSLTGDVVGELAGHRAWPAALALSPDGRRVASAGADATVLVWDLGLRRLLRRLDGHSQTVRALAFSADGTFLLSAGEDETLLVWDLQRLGLVAPEAP